MKIEKALKNLDQETVNELGALDAEGLKQKIVQSSQSVDQAEKELEANPDYINLKESLKAVTAGLKEVKKRQNSIITVCLANLEDKGQ